MIEKITKRQIVKTRGGLPVEIDLNIFRASYQKRSGTIVSRDFELEFGAVIWLAQQEKNDSDHVIELTLIDGCNVASSCRNGIVTPCDANESIISLTRRGWKKLDERRKTDRIVQVWAKKTERNVQ
jgi:hypothetical protein